MMNHNGTLSYHLNLQV